MERETAKEILISSLPAYLEQKGININHKFQCLCPDHMDNNPSMQYDKRRNSCHCFACGANANIFKLIEWDYNTTSFKESFEIGCDLFGLDIDNPKRITAAKMKPAKKKWVPKDEPVKADVSVCDKVYTMMKRLLPLSEKDMEYLKNTRRLDDARIEKDYFRMQVDNNVRKTIVRKLKKLTGYGKDILKTVPGFFVNKDGEIDYHSYKGIGILIRDVDGNAQAVQIRRDDNDKTKRYCWFSSGFAFDVEDLDGGCSPGAVKDILIPENPHTCICITEGRFKSEVLAQQGNIVISVQGVSTWKGMDKIIEKIMEKYEVRSIYLFFDADVMGNPQLSNTLKEMVVSLQNSFPNLYLKSGVWSVKDGKGVDDCVFNGNKSHIKYVYAIPYFETCRNEYRDLTRELGKSLKKADEKERKEIRKALQERVEKIVLE